MNLKNYLLGGAQEPPFFAFLIAGISSRTPLEVATGSTTKAKAEKILTDAGVTTAQIEALRRAMIQDYQ